MFEEFYEVTVRVGSEKEKRIAVLPVCGKEYWLGHHPDSSHIWSKSVHGIYMGHDDKEHIFMNLEGYDVELYACPVGECFVGYDGGGEDEPAVPFVGAKFKGLMSPGKEKDYAVQILKRKMAENEDAHRKNLEHLISSIR